MVRSFAFLVGLVLVVASLSLGQPDQRLVATILAASLGILMAFAYLVRGKGAVNPFNLALLAAVAVVVIGGTVFALTYLTPLGALALAAAVCSAAVYASAKRDRLREHRRSAGLCMKCGYDLCESPDRCPECGADLPDHLVYRRRSRARDELSEASEARDPL